MPDIEPPAGGLFRPAHRSTLAAGTTVWRVHSSRRSALAPNPTAQPDEFSGGRFDSLDGTYAYLYIADSPDGAIAETICRDLPLDPTVARIVPASAVTGRTLTAVDTHPHPYRCGTARPAPVCGRAGLVVDEMRSATLRHHAQVGTRDPCCRPCSRGTRVPPSAQRGHSRVGPDHRSGRHIASCTCNRFVCRCTVSRSWLRPRSGRTHRRRSQCHSLLSMSA